MRQRPWIVPALFAGLVIFGAPARARSDGIKHDLFVLGIHMSGYEGVAVQFRGEPTDRHPGAMTARRSPSRPTWSRRAIRLPALTNGRAAAWRVRSPATW